MTRGFGAEVKESWVHGSLNQYLGHRFSPSLLFDVLTEILKSSEGVCFFFLPKPGFGRGLGNQVGGGRLRAMNSRKPIELKTFVKE